VADLRALFKRLPNELLAVLGSGTSSTLTPKATILCRISSTSSDFSSR